MSLCGALAIHVADEALTDFLAVYNPTVVAIRESHPWLLLPSFTFNVWLVLLISAIIILAGLSFFVWKGRWAMRPLSYIFAAVMLANGVGHILSSLYMRKWMPGVFSSPLLLVASIALIIATRAHSKV